MLLDRLVNLPYPLLESGSEHVRVGQPLGASAESYAEFVAARQAMFETIADYALSFRALSHCFAEVSFGFDDLVPAFPVRCGEGELSSGPKSSVLIRPVFTCVVCFVVRCRIVGEFTVLRQRQYMASHKSQPSVWHVQYSLPVLSDRISLITSTGVLFPVTRYKHSRRGLWV